MCSQACKYFILFHFIYVSRIFPSNGKIRNFNVRENEFALQPLCALSIRVGCLDDTYSETDVNILFTNKVSRYYYTVKYFFCLLYADCLLSTPFLQYVHSYVSLYC